MTYIVHGATGAQGSPVLSALRAAGHSATAAVRDASTASGEAVSIDFFSVNSLTAAYGNAEGVFVHLPIGSPEDQARYARNIANALDAARPARVVFSTSGYFAGADKNPLSAHAILAEYLGSSGLSYAIVEPRLYLENLLLPPVMSAITAEGALRYPLREDYAVSWCSHLDVADVVTRLLTDHSTSGTIAIGAIPGLIGADLAEGFSEYFEKPIRFESITPTEFGSLTIPLFGEAGVLPVVAAYEHRQKETADVIVEERSAEKLLDLAPRSIVRWLRDLSI